MKRLLLTLFILLQGAAFVSSPATVIAQAPADPPTSDVLCLPGIYMIDPQDCLPLGPSSYRTRMASEGFSLPLINLPAHSIDSQLGVVPFSYARLSDGATPIYPTLQDAMDGKNELKKLDPGKLRFILRTTRARSPSSYVAPRSWRACRAT